MSKENGVILAKGIYKHPQAEGFISVKQFMFVQRDGVKHLIVRYSNDMDANVESMKFLLTEMNADGDVIATRHIKQRDLKADAGATFAPNEGIPILSECVDFKIKMLEASSGVYTYRYKGNKACVYYTPKQPNVPKPPAGTHVFSVRKLKVPKSRLLAMASIFFISIFIAVSILVSYVAYISDYNKRNEPQAQIEYYDRGEL
jgi:hypothetical protein